VTFTTDRHLVPQLRMGGYVPSQCEEGQLYYLILGYSMLEKKNDARSIIE